MERIEALTLAAERLHRELEHSYYSDPEGFPGGKAAFDEEHRRIWETLNQDLEANGYKVYRLGLTTDERLDAIEAWLNRTEPGWNIPF